MGALHSDSRVLLEGDTLRIGFHGVGKTPYPEDIVPAGVLRALAQHLAVDLGTEGVFWGDYCYFAGVTGEAFRFLEFMNLCPGEPGQPLVERYGQISQAQMYRLAFEAAGLAAELHLKPDLPDKDALRRRIVASLRDRRTPVIALGGFGPPEPCLITGFDQGGEVLLGWSHFQGEKEGDARFSFEPTGQFRLREWYEALDGVLIVTGTAARPAPREVYRGALERAIRELRAAEGSETLGTAAMAKWAAHLENEADFAGFSAEQWEKAQSAHGATAGDLAERRALAASFLSLACRHFPEAEPDLHRAETAFQGAHETVYEIWETAARTGPFDPDLARFQDPACRRTLASLVRRLAACDRRGLACLERAIHTIRGTDPGPAIPADPVLDGVAVLTKATTAEPGQPTAWAPENIALPNALGMLRTFLGEPFGALNEAEQTATKLDYGLWMGLTGAAVGMPGDGPERANLPLAFDALGYDYELWLSATLARETGLPGKVWGWDDNLKRRIFWNLRDRKQPVLLFGCGDWPDWYLVTEAKSWGCFRGYGGSTGEGYRPGEPLDHPKNPLRPIDLFAGMKGERTWTLNVLARRPTPKPPLEVLYQRAIEWGATTMRQQRMKLLDAAGEEFLSTRPYQDWAAMLRADALFPSDDVAVLQGRRAWLEGAEVELAERRFYGAAFLDLAAIRLARPELKEAAEHFRAVHDLMQRIWAHVGGLGSPQAYLRLAEGKTREAIADLLMAIERNDAAAAALLSGGTG